jgi:hypothetical protein
MVAAAENRSMLGVIKTIGAVNAADATCFLDSVPTVDAIGIRHAARNIGMSHSVGTVHSIGTVRFVGAIGHTVAVGVVQGVGMNMLISTVKNDMSIGTAISKASTISTSSKILDTCILTC